ncbi:hypothetical protein K9M74_00040 [Candidatus Woesearchaeota archaeon]|nr:hypothetical protein [Candidatus Woesearchaeota archaeon]
MKAWYKRLGYYENPFLIKPLQEMTKLYGQEEQLNDALYYVRSGATIFVEAKKGAGKTKFLRKIIESFKGRIIYVDAAKLKKNLNIEELLRKRNGMKGKLLGSKPREMILVIDNVDELSHVNTERLKYYFDYGYLHSVVMAGKSFKKVPFSESMANRIGRRVIKLDDLTKDQAIELAFERLDEFKDDEDALIKQKLIQKIFEKNTNPRMFLINLHRVFEEMGFEEDEKVLDKHLNILDEPLDAEDEEDYASALGEEVISDEEKLVDEKGNKIMKVGEYYRCPAYEMFCGNCGAIVKRTDTCCPECNAEFENTQEEGEKNE